MGQVGTGPGATTLSVSEFLSLPFAERVRAILGDSLRFFSGGEPIDRGVALRALRVRNVEPR